MLDWSAVRGKAASGRRYRSILYSYKTNALIQIPCFSDVVDYEGYDMAWHLSVLCLYHLCSLLSRERTCAACKSEFKFYAGAAHSGISLYRLHMLTVLIKRRGSKFEARLVVLTGLATLAGPTSS